MLTNFPAVGKISKGSFVVCSENNSVGMGKIRNDAGYSS